MKFKVFILSLSIMGCSSPGGNSKHSVPLPIASQFSELDARRLQELARIRRAVGDAVWPGYGQAELSMIVVGNKNQWTVKFRSAASKAPITKKGCHKDSLFTN